MKKMLILFATALLLLGCQTKNDTPEPIDVDYKLGVVEFAPHGNKSFSVTSVSLEDDIVASANIIEYSFWSYESYDTVTCVPNGDDIEGFGGNYDSTEKCLGSKNDNNAVYSSKMADVAGATNDWIDSINAIEDYAIGKTIEELKSYSETDSVAGSTLSDTYGYLQSIISAAEAAE